MRSVAVPNACSQQQRFLNLVGLALLAGVSGRPAVAQTTERQAGHELRRCAWITGMQLKANCPNRIRTRRGASGREPPLHPTAPDPDPQLLPISRRRCRAALGFVRHQPLPGTAETNGVGARRPQRARRRIDRQAKTLERLHTEQRPLAIGDHDGACGAAVTDPDHDEADLGLKVPAVGEDDGLLPGQT